MYKQLKLKKMPYRKSRFHETDMEVNNSYEGEPIEEKIRRIMNNGEPITDSAPLIYTDRKAGVLPEHDIRTDRFEKAIEAADKLSGSYRAAREERHKLKDEEKPKNEGGAQSIQGPPEKS